MITFFFVEQGRELSGKNLKCNLIPNDIRVATRMVEVSKFRETEETELCANFGAEIR